ncbi:MAG: hypothetical protein P8Y14_28805, partial [Anaerolineales bacterium]
HHNRLLQSLRSFAMTVSQVKRIAGAVELLAMTGGLGTGWREMGKRGGEADQGPLTMDDLAISG